MLLALWLAAGVLLLAHAPAWADIHDEFRACMYEFSERAEDQGDGQSKFFARWLRVKENCVGYRNEWERERFLFICAEPSGRAFASSHQRNMWLSEERNKFERTLQPIDDGFGRGACGAAGGSWGGGGCRGDGGRTFDAMQQDRYGRNLW